VNKDGQFTNNLDITGDGLVDARDWEIGAFKIANSYGTWWENNGFTYALYRSFALNYDEGGIWNNRVYGVEADTSYHPLLTLRATLNYNTRNKIRILAGVCTDTLQQMPDHVIDFPIFNFQGGAHAMQGNDTIPEDKSLELGLDVTALLNYVSSGQPAKYFLMIEEKDPDHAGQGKIEHASFISYPGAPLEIRVPETDVVIKDNNTTFVSAVASFGKPLVQITTTTLPPKTSPQPVQVQLGAAGGTPPYEWSFVEEYLEKPLVKPEPQITGTSIQVHYETRTFASVALPFSFPFFGRKFDSIYVNYFGFIAFEPQNLPAPYITDEMGMLRMFPLVAPSFSQNYTYQANKNDGIWFQADASHAIIRWKVSVSRYVTSSTDDFAVILYPDGRVEFLYGMMDNQGFVHTFYKGISKGDGLNFALQTQWNANELSGKGFLFVPPPVPESMTLSKTGLLTVEEADSSKIYVLNVRVSDAGKISDSKTLMLSGKLGMVHELICGEDSRLKSGREASLRLIVTNQDSQDVQNLVLKITGDSLVQITDSLFTVPLLNAGQSLTIPVVFRFRLNHPLENGFPVSMTLFARTAGQTFEKDLVFPVAAAELKAEYPIIMDGDNERLDPGEVADLVVNIKNTGGLDAEQLQLKIESPGPDIAIMSDPLVVVPRFGAFTSRDFHFQVKAARNAMPGSDAPIQIFLNDTTGSLQTLEFNCQIGTKPVALVNLAASNASVQAMAEALDSLHVGYDTLSSLPFDYRRYASIFLILGTATSGSYTLTENDGSSLAAYLQEGGNLYMEGYYTWYYLNKTMLHPMFNYTSKKIPAYFYTDVAGKQGTFSEGMSYVYAAPMNYAVFNFEPVAPAFSTLTNTDNPAKNLEVVYDGNGYKTIGSMLDFSAMNGITPQSSNTAIMQRYLEFFALNIAGPFPLFHAGMTAVCKGQSLTFTDDSFDNITSRLWEFPGGFPSTSTELNPVIRYDTAGKFSVRLTVSDGIHTQSMLKEQYIQVGTCAGAADLTSSTSLFRLFPNPATEQVTIEFTRNISGVCTLTLYGLTGNKVKEVQQAISEGNQISLQLSGLSKGLYFLRVNAGGSVSTRKVIIN
jgi:PKD repeat protein